MKLPETQANERGVALLLTLGVLSLLLILTMSFAFTARTELLASEVNADMVKARLLCESGLERVLGFIHYSCNLDSADRDDTIWEDDENERLGVFPNRTGLFQSFSDDNKTINYFQSSVSASNLPGPGASGSLEEGFYKARTANEDTAVSFGDLSLFNTTHDDAPRVDWQNIYGDPDATPAGHNGKLIGRVAFFVMDDSGKVDPAVVAPSGNAERPGSAMDEISISDVDSDFSSFGTDLAPTGRAFSWEHIMNAMGLSETEANDAVERFTVSSVSEPIAAREMIHQVDLHELLFELSYNEDSSGNIITNGRVGTSTDVDNLVDSTDGIPWLVNWSEAGNWMDAATRAKQIAANIVDYFDNDYDHDGNSYSDHIPTTNGTDYVGIEKVPMINDIRLQVTNTSTVSGDPDGSLSETPPTFTGDETWSPELTVVGDVEILFPFILDAWEDILEEPSPTSNREDIARMRLGNGCKLEMVVRVEYLIMDDIATTPSGAGPDGKWTPDVDNVSRDETVTLTWSAADFLDDSTDDCLLDPIFNTPPDSTYDFEHYARSKAVQATTISPSYTSSSSGIAEIRVQVDSVTLWRNDDVVWDYAEVAQSGTPYYEDDSKTPDDSTHEVHDFYALYSTIDTLSSGPTECCFFAEVDDVRQNHNEENWSWRTYVDFAGGATPNAAFTQPPIAASYFTENRGKNSNCNPGGAGDSESSATYGYDPTDANYEVSRPLSGSATNIEITPVSSAYIRNGYAKYKSELGIIHRASNWQTLNLCAYNDGASGGGAYADGDRNILEQVWLRKDTQMGPPPSGVNLESTFKMLGRINPNADWTSTDPNLQAVGQALFAGIRPGDHRNPPGVSTPDDLVGTEFLSEIRAESVGGNPLASAEDVRDRIGDAMLAASGVTDRQREVALLHTENLISPKYSYFTVAVIAQAIKDIQPSYPDPECDPTGDDGDEVGYGHFDNQDVLDYVAANQATYTSASGTPYSQPAPDIILAEQMILARVARNNWDAGLTDGFTDQRTGRSFTYLGRRSDGHRYYISDAAVDAWSEAKAICETNGGYLVSFESADEDEWDFFVNTLSPAQNCWIGLYRSGDTTAAPSSNSEWSWCSGGTLFSANDFTSWSPNFWASGEPTATTSPGPDNNATVVWYDESAERCEDTSIDNDGTALYFIMECEPVIQVLDYRYLED